MKRIKRRTICRIPYVLVSLFVFTERIEGASLSSSRRTFEKEASPNSLTFTQDNQNRDEHIVQRHLAEMAVIHSSVDYLGVYEICSSIKTYIEDNTMIVLREKQNMQRYKCKQYFEVKNPNSQLNLNCQLLNIHRSCIKESLTIYVEGVKKAIICGKKSYPKVWMGKQIFLHYVRRFFRESEGYLCSLVALTSNGDMTYVNISTPPPERSTVDGLNFKIITTSTIPSSSKAGQPTSFTSDMKSSVTSNPIPTTLELPIGVSSYLIPDTSEFSSSYTPPLLMDSSFKTSVLNETIATSATETLQPEMLSEVSSDLISDTTNIIISSGQTLSTESLSETSLESISDTTEQSSSPLPTFYIDSTFKTVDVISSKTDDNSPLSTTSMDFSTNTTDFITSTAQVNLSLVQTAMTELSSEVSSNSVSTTPEVSSLSSILLDFTFNATDLMSNTSGVGFSEFPTSLTEISSELHSDLMPNTSGIATSPLPQNSSIDYFLTQNTTDLISSSKGTSLSTVQTSTTEISEASSDSILNINEISYFPTSTSLTDPLSNTSDLLSTTTEVSVASSQTMSTDFTSKVSSILVSNTTENVSSLTILPMESSFSTSDLMPSTTRTTLSQTLLMELTHDASSHLEPSTTEIGSLSTHTTETSIAFDHESNSTTADISTVDALIVSKTTDPNSFITHAISNTVASTTENTLEENRTRTLPSISTEWSNTTETDLSIVKELINPTFSYENVTKIISAVTSSQESSSKSNLLYSVEYSTVNNGFSSVTPSTSHVEPVTYPQFELCERCGTSAYMETQIYKGKIIKKSFPWMVFVLVETDSFTGNCGGVLISSRTVVTTAHCLDFDIRLIFLGFGMTNLLGEEEGGFWLPAEGYKLFDGYDQDTFEGDIAIITLAKDVQFNDFVRPICLPEINLRPKIGDSVTVLGWSITSSPDASLTHTLQEVNLTVWSNIQCGSIWSPFGFPISHGQMCVAKRGNKPCLGDSGGPAMIMVKERWVLVGVVSYGFRCSAQTLPGVNTGIANFLDWINENTLNTTCAYLPDDFSITLNDSFNDTFGLPQDLYK